METIRSQVVETDAPLFLDARCENPVDACASVESLGLDNGCMLFCRRESTTVPARPGAEAADSPFGARDRGKPATKVRSLNDLDSETQRVKPQEKPTCARLSLDRAAMLNVATFLQKKESELGGPNGPGAPRRVALLLGSVESVPGSPSSEGGKEWNVRVDAVWEPPQPKATVDRYDSSSLRRAVQLPSSPCQRLGRATGLRCVGFLFSHTPREHFLSSEDVFLTAGLQCDLPKSGENKDDDEGGVSMVIVAACVKPDSDITYEAYQISDQAHEWVQAGTFVADSKAADGRGNDESVIRTSMEVLAQGYPTRSVDTALLAVPVPVVTHEGMFRSFFPPNNRPTEGVKKTKLLKRLLEDGKSGSPEEEPLEERLRDFHALLFLQRWVSDMAPLVEAISNRTPLPPYYRMVLEELCNDL